MTRDQLAFLVGGFAFGIIFGWGLFQAFATRPGAAAAVGAEATAPMGPSAMGQSPPMGGGPGQVPAGPATTGGAPMVQEINALKRAVQEDPSNLQAWTRLANLYHDGGMFPQAIEFYEKAIELSPRDPDLITDMGICYEQQRQFARALELFQKAQSLDPNHWQSLYNIVVVSTYGLGAFDQAADALARLEKVNPSAPNLQQFREAIDRGRRQRPGEARS